MILISIKNSYVNIFTQIKVAGLIFTYAFAYITAG